MKKMKSVVAGILAAMMIVGCTGCGDKQNAESGDKIKLQWMGIPYFASSEEGSYAEKLMEEKFGIEIEPIFLDEEAYKTRKPVMMSSGEIPDIIYELDPIDCQADAKQKFLAEITYEEIKTNLPEYVAHVNEKAPQAWLYPYYEGKNYGVPNMYYSGKDTNNGMWRMDWLKNVGIDKVPETIAEFEEAFTKFANEDPDGNGQKDTYGFSGDLKSFHWCFTEIFGAYGALPFNWIEKDGKIVYGGTQPEVKEVLELLASWYKKGIIHPDFITDAIATSYYDKFKTGSIGYIPVFGGYSALDEEESTSAISILKTMYPEAEIAVSKLPTGPEGKKGGFAWGQAGHIIAMGRQVADDAAKKTKIFEIINTLYKDEDLITKVSMGEEGTHYAMTGDEDVYEWLGEYTDSEKRSKTMAATSLGNAFFGIVPPRTEITDKWASQAVIEFNNKMWESNVNLYDAFLKPDVVPTTDKYLGDLRNNQLVYFGKIIMGEQPVSYYDEFIKEWNELGGAEMEENANKTNEVYKGILEQLK